MSLTKEIVELLNYKAEGPSVEQGYTFTGNIGPVVAIPGIFGGWTKAGMVGFMMRNKVAGSLLSLDPVKSVTELKLSIKEVIERHNNPTIVGFSAGGLLALNIVEEYGLWEKINKIVTIATPFGGIPKIFGSIAPIARDVQVGSELVEAVNAINPPERKVVSVFAEDDMYIPNPRGMGLSWQTEIVGARSHGEIQNYRKWYGEILLQCINSGK